MKKKILIFLIIIIFCLGFLVTKEAKAGDEHNVYGWAWSENLGWISFNSTSDGSDVNYGVHICESDIDLLCSIVTAPKIGKFIGYAWSRGTTANPGGVGWIKFDPIGPYPSSPNYSACLDLPGVGQSCDGAGDYTVSGWARAYRAITSGGQTLGGWDGWIKLGGTWGDGVLLNITPNPMEFEGWAWGGDDSDEEAVIGWISFNCVDGGNGQINICGTSDYKVMTNLSLASPTALISCDPSSCEVYYKDVVLTLNNDSSDPDGSEDIKKSEWSIKEQEQPNSAYQIKRTCPPDNPTLCPYSIAIDVGPGRYTAKLRVEDSTTGFGEGIEYFWIKRDITAGFSCCLDDLCLVWQDCDSLTPIPGMGDIVYFKDNSEGDGVSNLPEYSIPSEAATINTWVWKKDGSSFGANSSYASTTVAFFMVIELTVRDTESREDNIFHIIGDQLPLPKWKEIPPF